MMTAKSIALASSAALILAAATPAQVSLSDRGASVDPGASAGPWIVYEVSGGFAGIQQQLRILADGEAFARNSVGGRLVARATGIVSLADLNALDSSVRTVFQSAESGVPCPGADHLNYLLKSSVRGFPESLLTCMPTAEEQALFQTLDALRAEILAGPQGAPVKLLDSKILLSDASGVRQGGVTVLSNGQAMAWTQSGDRHDQWRFQLDASAMQQLVESVASEAVPGPGSIGDTWGPKVIIDYGPPHMDPYDMPKNVWNSPQGSGPVPPGGGVWDPGKGDFGGVSKDPGSTADTGNDAPDFIGQKKDPTDLAPKGAASDPGVGHDPGPRHDLDDVDSGVHFQIKIYDPRGVMTLLPGDCTAAHSFGLAGILLAYLCNG